MGFSSSVCSQTLRLEECIQAARRNNPDLQVRREAVAVAGSEIDMAEAETGPELSLSAFANVVSVVPELTQPEQTLDTPAGPVTVPGSHRRLGDEDRWEAAVTVNQVVYAGGRIRGAVDQAEIERDAAAAAIPVAQLAVDRQATDFYLDLARAIALKDVAAVRLETARMHAGDVRDLVDAGVLTENELLKAELRVSEAEEDVISNDNGIRVALDGLARVTGRRWEMPGRTVETVLPGIAAEIPVPAPGDAVRLAGLHRPELQQLEVLRTSLKHRQCLIRRENRPVISGYGKAAFGKPGPDFIANDWIDSYEAGIQMRMNLWDNGRISGRVSRISRELARLDAERSAVLAQIELEVRNALIRIRDTGARLEVAERSVVQAEENFRITRDRYDTGVLTHTDYLDAETLVYQRRINRVVLLTELERAWYHFILALGLDPVEIMETPAALADRMALVQEGESR